MNLVFLITSVVKIVAILAYLYGLLWALGRKQWWAKLLGLVVAFAVVQLALMFGILNDFDSGLLYQAATMAMVAMGLNLIYGFNGQFSLGQWGFYGLGAYAAADITWRWVNGDSRGLFVAGFGVILAGVAIWLIRKLTNRYKGMPVLSQFTLYLLGVIVATGIAVLIGNAINSVIAPMLAPGAALAGYIPQQIVFFFAVLIAIRYNHV